MAKTELVATWLNGIGLSHVIPMFTAAGIVTPSALAELEVDYFEALGVTNPEERRKLFYLVQRIKLAVDKTDQTAEKEVDAVLSANLQHTTVNNNERRSVIRSPTSKSSYTSIQQNGLRRNGSEVLSDDGSTELDNGESDWDGEDITHNADDESSSANIIRRSKRLQAKQWNKVNKSIVADDDRSTRSIPAPSSRQSHGGGGGGGSRKGRRSSSTASRRRVGGLQKSTDSDSEHSSPRRTPRMRKTGIQGPRTRHNPNLSKSSRTGKRLSTIPAERIAPMSPLLDLPNSKLEEEIHGQEVQSRRQKKKVVVSSDSDDSDRNLTKSSSDSDSRLSSRTPTRTPAKSRRKKCQKGGTAVGNGNSSDSDQVTTPKMKRNGYKSKISRSPMADFKAEENIPPMSTSRSVPLSSKPKHLDTSVVMHGMNEVDDSFKSQISQLREDVDAEYNLFFNEMVLSQHDVEDMQIRVVVRKRPMSNSEADVTGNIDVIHPLDYGPYGRIVVYNPKRRVDLTKEIETIPFAYDNVFDEKSNNVQIYQRTVQNLIPSVFDGQWATVFAYGQTGSGKTFTMMGSSLTGINNGTARWDESNFGLYYLAAIDIFKILQKPENGNLTLGVSLFEIYGGKLFDLLNERNPVKCLEDSKGKVCFPGLSEHPLSSADNLMEIMEEGGKNRSTGSTSKNADSSRSHAVLQLHLRKHTRRRTAVEQGRFTFCDLAGSERGADTANSSHATRMEGAEINTSLLALKEVIRALATGDSMTHVPFRGSKLTQVLKEGFVGKNSRSVMIACISPNSTNCEQTLNTLRYADRVKERNAETGSLSAATSGRGRRRTSQIAQPLFQSDADTSCVCYLDEKDISEEEALVSDCNDRSEGEDRASHVHHHVHDELHGNSYEQEPVRQVYGGVERTNKEQLGINVIDQHKEVMSTMLGMVKDEMIIVNKADSDRYDLEQYLVKLDSIQEQQLSLIKKLRQSIHAYNNDNETADTAINKTANRAQYLSDDSFEDLRD